MFPVFLSCSLSQFTVSGNQCHVIEEMVESATLITDTEPEVKQAWETCLQFRLQQD